MTKEYAKRITACIIGFFFCGLGNFFGVRAGQAGTNPWNTFALGLGGVFGLTFGEASLLVSIAVIVLAFLGRGKLGVGTILNILLIPWFSDLLLEYLTFIPEAKGVVMGVVFTLLGQFIHSFATIVQMRPGLGCGPRDTLMVIIGRKLPFLSIGTVKFCIEIFVLLAGTLMGAPFGLGTVLVLALQASIFQFACTVTRYDPRLFVHEDLKDTLQRLRTNNR